MADYAGVQDTRMGTIEWILPPSKSTGKHVPPAGTLAVAEVGTLPIGADGYTYVDEGGPVIGGGEHTGAQDDRWTFAEDWFETVHLLPRGGIDFENIVTITDERFELFNSFRHANVSLISITNNATPGVELPDMPSPPDSIGPLQSYIDPLSPALAPLGMVVRALTQGLPSFDTTIDFAFGSGVGTLYLPVMGNRIALITADFEGGLTEILKFSTDILLHKDGSEQRISNRKNPRQAFETILNLESVQRQIVQSLLFGWQGMTIALPIWEGQMKVTAAITGGVTDTVQVDSTDYIDIRVGGLATIYKNDTTFDVLDVKSMTSTSITFNQTIASSFSIGDRVAPVRLSVIKGAVQGQRPPVNLEKMAVKFLVIENDTGAPTGDTSAYSSYDGKVLLDDSNFIRGSMSETFEQNVSITDSITGILSQATSWDTNKRAHVKGFVVRTREDLWNMRRLFYALRGRQTSFYIPTFMEDLTVTQNLVSGTATMTISNIGYVRFIQDQAQKSIFKITFTDGTSLVRVVQSSEQLSATEEKLTLDANWPSNKNAEDVQRVQFYELVRSDTDDIRIDHSSTVGRAKVSLPVKMVFN